LTRRPVSSSPWLAWVRRLQAVAQNGLQYAKDDFERERFAEVRAIAAEIGALGGAPAEELAATFAAESGHASPKLDVRAAAFRDDGRVLLVRGLDDGRWTVPGGWAEVGETPRVAVEKELREESGYTGRAVSLIGVFERDARDRSRFGFYAWKVWFRCELDGGDPAPPQASEITDVGFFAEDEVPELSLRTPPEQLAHAFAQFRDSSLPPAFD
jgi:ADP-ribose pyrophosphatase YjhB (NUDIX family)